MRVFGSTGVTTAIATAIALLAYTTHAQELVGTCALSNAAGDPAGSAGAGYAQVGKWMQ